MNDRAAESTALARELKLQFFLLGGIVTLMWAIEMIDIPLGGSLDLLGIRPRSMNGLLGIVCAPFLHGGFRHLLSNTLPFLVLGFLISAQDWAEWVVVSIVAALSSGLGTWLLGTPGTLHIGASGVVFGYFGFLVTRAYFERNLGSIAISLLVIALFGGMIWGILPIQVGISWEGHLFGLIGGIVSAKLIAGIKRATS